MSGPRSVPDAKQPDKGYEESHGYGPSHGGPTGPGDAPAKKDPAAPPPPDEDEDEDVETAGAGCSQKRTDASHGAVARCHGRFCTMIAHERGALPRAQTGAQQLH